MDPVSTERRRQRHTTNDLLPRHNFDLLLVVGVRGVALEVVDFSDLGFGFRLPPSLMHQRLRMGAIVLLKISNNQLQLDLYVRVAWQNGLEVGVEIDWHKNSPIGQGFLRRLSVEAAEKPGPRA